MSADHWSETGGVEAYALTEGAELWVSNDDNPQAVVSGLTTEQAFELGHWLISVAEEQRLREGQ